MAMHGIRPLIELYIKSGKEVDMDRLVAVEMDNILQVWKDAHPGYRVLYRQEFDKERARIKAMEEDLLRKTKEVEMQCRKSMKVRAINIAATETLVSSMLEDAGYKDYSIENQRYRIKLTVFVGDKRIVLPIRFAAMPGIVESIIPTLKAAEAMVADFGKDLKIL